MFKSTPARSVDVGSWTDEDVLAGEQIGENTAMQLLEDMTEATGDVERSSPASHSTPKTSPQLVQATSPVQGYQQRVVENSAWRPTDRRTDRQRLNLQSLVFLQKM